jgi:hypothetical protein
MRRRMPTGTIIACMWGHHRDEIPATEAQALGADVFAVSMVDAVKLCREAARREPVSIVANPTAA